MPVDFVSNIVDLGKSALGSAYMAASGKGVPKALEVNSDRSGIYGSSDNIRKLMGKGGLQTRPERPDDAASRYLFAGGSAMPAALSMNPGGAKEAAITAAQAFGIGMVPQYVADQGGSPSAQMMSGIGASVLIPAGIATGRTVAGSAQPLTDVGRRQIAGAAIRGAATNADDAIRNLDSAVPLVPGSMPTAGQAARDPGIAYFENRLRGLNGASFAERTSQQNNARQRLLDTVARGGDDVAVAALEARRESITTNLRDRAFQQAQGKEVPTQAVVSRIDSLLANPENAGRTVQNALRSVRNQMFDENGALITDPRAVYALRKENSRIIDGKFVNSDESVLRYASGQLRDVNRAIDSAMTEVAPSWNEYLIKYRQLSRPIERAQTMGQIRQKTDLSAPDIQTGRSYLSQPKWKNVVTKNMPDLREVMTKGQLQKMQMVAADLDRGAAASNAANIKISGSDTAANLAVNGQLSVANILGRTLGKDIKELPPALATMTRPMSWLYKLPDESIRGLISDAMLDPKLSASLMREGTKENIQTLADSFRKQAELTGVLSATSDTAK